ncbi:MAG TPA: cytochrome C assembly protein [Candidatus Marinimicrobia bacterium]|nr:cytochrome C assembly protein [Candidatus Neomarinimicrobiota bacterium]HIB95212.1 cytochrome C assembly protein [Candidatus Neomarinimicrobiota bacterium]HIO75042.1 cytochrome C assembly protein [Candidatus Neomarinimicrobiota bacterium]HIO89695.1 cytochrome C assembly protein [Candidatus Neomarinimicrobiota bacterium]
MESFHSKQSSKLMVGAIAVLWITVLYLVLSVTRIDPEQQMAQKIFYYHVPSAWTAGVAYLLVMIAAVLYLMKKDEKFDHLGLAAAELGTLFCALVLITGPIWAKPIWGAPWSWEPRLTTVLIMFLIYIGYFMVRNFGDEGERTRRISSVIGIAAFFNVPIIYVSVKFWAADAQLHPQPAMGQQSPDVFWTFMLSLLVFTLLFVHMLRYRVHILKLRSKVLKMRYDV